MTTLREAAQQALKALTPFVRGSWTPGLAVQAAAAMDRLKAALAEPVEPVKQCMAHGECFGGECIYQRPAEPVQEPQGCDHCNHPLYAATKCRVCGRATEPTPPQRKPLAEWQINDLMADIDPEDRDSWSFRQGVYAAEKHHGVRK